MQQSKTAIVWFTNNLRVSDNKILSKASLLYDKVIAVYCFDPDLFKKKQFGFRKIEKFRAKFLIETIKDLSNSLRSLNVPLFLCCEHPHAFLPKFCLTQQADALFFQKESTSEELEEIRKIKKELHADIEIHEEFDQFLFSPEDIPYSINELPEVFTSFRKKVEKECNVEKIILPVSKPISNFIDFKTKIPSLSELGFKEFSESRNSAFPFKGGETIAKNRLEDYFFTKRKLGTYKETRNGLLGVDYSSKFSPWLANGAISARTIYWEVIKYESEFGSNQSTYWLIFELIWRDYFKFLALKHKNHFFKLTGIKQTIKYRKNDIDLVHKWIEGKTNTPFVNANMIELKETGWMSNRGRQVVASYFTKELELDWRIGAAYFESMLLDYDVHSNYGNWQYVAGVGNDPRDRKFNMQQQTERYDPEGKYQRLWLYLTLI